MRVILLPSPAASLEASPCRARASRRHPLPAGEGLATNSPPIREIHFVAASPRYAFVVTPLFTTYTKSSGLMGSRRIRLPVALKIAFVTAGAIAGVLASPIPPGGFVLGTM